MYAQSDHQWRNHAELTHYCRVWHNKGRRKKRLSAHSEYNNITTQSTSRSHNLAPDQKCHLWSWEPFEISLSIRRFWGKGERWKRKRERVYSKLSDFYLSKPPVLFTSITRCYCFKLKLFFLS